IARLVRAYHLVVIRITVIIKIYPGQWAIPDVEPGHLLPVGVDTIGRRRGKLGWCKRQSCRATSSLVDDTQKTYHIATSVLVLGIGRIAVITAVPGRINTLWKAQISFHSFFIRIATR